MKKLIYIILSVMLLSIFLCVPVYSKENSKENIIICIDPGHGGDNLGGEYSDYTEKDMTMIVANAMKEELSNYEGIEVYLTRTEDKKMSLEERVEYADKVNADFLFCLHFNMSENHELYGAECWVSAFGDYYSRGYDFASIEMDMLTGTGLYDRGIKTRLNSKGTNYYGILRIADLKDIPGIIIEHCHLDNKNDIPYYDHYEKLIEYGKLDATAVAKYYGLKSKTLGVDYSDFYYDKTPVPAEVVKPDDTPPLYCNVEITDIDTSNRDYAYITLKITSEDAETDMLYYSYTIDDGVNFSERLPWKTNEYLSDNSVCVRVEVDYDHPCRIAARAYNLHGYDVTSDILIWSGVDSPYAGESITEESNTSDIKTYEEIDRTLQDNSNENTTKSTFDSFEFAVISVLLLLFVIVLVLLICFFHNMHKCAKRDKK